jgi:hypothetical protein
MTVRQLLEVFEDHTYVNVAIIENVYNPFEDDMEETVVASWNYKDHYDWYCGQLSYLSERSVNPLIKWLDYNVKSFTVLNDIMLNGIQCLYITI